MLIVIIVAIAGGTGSGTGNGGHAGLARTGSAANNSGQAPSASVSAAPPASTTTHKPSHHTHHATTSAPPPPLSHAAQLQQAGHLLLAEGRYSAAIPALRAAIGASGESASNCSQPNTPGCVAYAEALFDLGRALRLDNANAAAGAVLRERRRIDSQRTAVQHEIGLNRRRHATTPSSRGPAPHARTPHTITPKSRSGACPHAAPDHGRRRSTHALTAGAPPVGSRIRRAGIPAQAVGITAAATWSCTKRTTAAPSPTAVAQRFSDPARTSPAA